MANEKISAMPPASTLMGMEAIPMVQGGANVAGTPSQLATYVGGVVGTPALVLLSQIITSGAQTSVTFTPPTSGYQDLEIRVRGTSAALATQDAVALQLNGDTGANYYVEQAGFNYNVAAVGEGIAATNLGTGQVAAATATAGVRSYIHITIPNYLSSTGYKVIQTENTASFTILSRGQYGFLEFGQWASTAAVTSVKLFLTSGAAFTNGTIISLYGHL